MYRRGAPCPVLIVARGRDESVERVSRSAPFNAFLLGEAHGSAVVPNLSFGFPSPGDHAVRSNAVVDAFASISQYRTRR